MEGVPAQSVPVSPFRKLLYDGDRVMAVYIGDAKNTQAVRTAMKINYTVAQIINPALKKQYPNDSYQVRQVVGVDTSELWIARVGIRNDNDLVWVGRAANYAAKLCSESADYPTYITADVFSRMADMVKYSSADHTLMWTEFKWAARGNIVVHRSNWWYTIS
jgi:class 3 adenylate cyclase